MTDVRKELILALGSNYKQREYIGLAQSCLRQRLCREIVFTRPMWTRPIGIVSAEFLNCLAFCHTTLGPEQVTEILKDIERTCGSTASERTHGIIRIDIDLLKHGDTVMHERDWSRDYITEMMKLCPF